MMYIFHIGDTAHIATQLTILLVFVTVQQRHVVLNFLTIGYSETDPGFSQTTEMLTVRMANQ